MPGLSRRRFLRVLGAGTAPLLLSACGAGAQPAPAQATAAPAPAATEAPAAAGRTFRYALSPDIVSLDPAFFTHQSEDLLLNCIYSNLVAFGPNTYELQNDLAETIEQSDDGLTVSFKLKEGVQWHKGYGEVTAEDVKFSFERVADPEIASPYAGDWSALDHVEVTGTYTGTIVLKETYAPLWTTTMPATSGRVLCKKYVEEVGSEKLAQEPIGSGPYVLEEWRPGSRVVLKANPDYYGSAAFDEIHAVVVSGDAAQIAFEAGELDWIAVGMEYVDNYRTNPDYVVVQRPALNYEWIGMNIEHPKLQDIRVRQAIRYALDVPAMLTVIGMGGTEPARALIPTGMLGHWADAPRYERDLDKAKALLAEAGVPSLELKLDTVAGAGGGNPLAEVVQQNLKEAGISVTVNPLDDATYWALSEGEKGKEIELFWSSFYTQPDPAWCTMWFTCDQVGVWNWMRWCSAEFDELHAKAMATLDPDEREAMYIRMQELWDEVCHSVFTTYGLYSFVHRPDIEPATTPNGLVQFNYMAPA